MTDSFGARATLAVGGNDYEIYRLDAVTEGHVARLPYSLKILLENLLRHSPRRASSCRTLPAYRPLSTSRPCASRS
jgi:aconitate hydratase